MLKGKTIILGVTGCIAAYKSATVVSRLKDLGADVWVVMTAEATKLVGPITFRTLSKNPVIVDLFSEEIVNLTVPHISLAQKANLIVIAPCTANIIGKLANGIADDAITTITMASKATKLLAPAMNSEMWRNQVVSDNMNKLKKLGFLSIGPAEGKLACGEEDIGRMSEPEEILDKIISLLAPKQDLKGKTILVTAGGTREAIDPVRYISNRSSGKMGYEIAEAARERGAAVTLISAPVNLDPPAGVKVVKVESAEEMLKAAQNYSDKADAVIMTAAVADFKPKQVAKGKIKKAVSRKLSSRGGSASGGRVESRIEVEETKDILKAISKQKAKKGRIVVGFALETEDIIKNAKKKLADKNLDFIVANDDSTFGSDEIKFAVIAKNQKVENYPLMPKEKAANIILDRISE